MAFVFDFGIGCFRDYCFGFGMDHGPTEAAIICGNSDGQHIRWYRKLLRRDHTGGIIQAKGKFAVCYYGFYSGCSMHTCRLSQLAAAIFYCECCGKNGGDSDCCCFGLPTRKKTVSKSKASFPAGA